MKTKILLPIFFATLFFQAQAFSKMRSNDGKEQKQEQINLPMQQTQDTLGIYRYGEKIAGLLKKSDWPALLGEIHAVNLPEGWQEMIKPSFEDYFGKALSVEVISVKELPEYQLKWLYKAQEAILVKTKHAIRLYYDDSNKDEIDKGKLELAIYEHDGVCSILLVGNQ